jgi:hypothetical protein
LRPKVYIKPNLTEHQTNGGYSLVLNYLGKKARTCVGQQKEKWAFSRGFFALPDRGQVRIVKTEVSKKDSVCDPAGGSQ